jgi:hypothetical protein
VRASRVTAAVHFRARRRRGAASVEPVQEREHRLEAREEPRVGLFFFVHLPRRDAQRLRLPREERGRRNIQLRVRFQLLFVSSLSVIETPLVVLVPATKQRGEHLEVLAAQLWTRLGVVQRGERDVGEPGRGPE